jgi:hypothetical protein
MTRQEKAVLTSSGSQSDQQPHFAIFLGHIEEPVAAIRNDTNDEEAEIPRDICKGNLNESKKGTPLVDWVPNANNKGNRSECQSESKYL